MDALPKVFAGFLVNIGIFLIAEVLILVLALVLAAMRSLKDPVFFPLRLFAIVYIDLFRGLPSILIIYVLGLGIPALGLPGVTNRRLRLGDRGAGPGVDRVRGRGLPGGHRLGPSQPGGSGPLAGPVRLPGVPVRGPAAGRSGASSRRC